MKPFDLEAALAGEPVVTRDGRPVKIAGYNPDANENTRIIGWIGSCSYVWYDKGSYWNGATDDKDLFMAEKPKIKKEGWVNIYPTNDPNYSCFTSDCYLSEEDAEENIMNGIIATVKVEWEEEA